MGLGYPDTTQDLEQRCHHLELENAYLRGQLDGAFRNLGYFQKDQNSISPNGLAEVARSPIYASKSSF